jgi:hypothetical protein
MRKLSIVGIAISGCAILIAAAGLALSIIGVVKAE